METKNKVYLYSRVSTDEQTTAQQERAVYEWLHHRGMEVDVVVSDEGISGGVSYKDRKLGKELLPIMKAGDMLIVSEISRLGRSMFDLSTLIHTELKPRKIRLVVVAMGLDLRCDHLTAMDELILNNFSFAAQLEKQLISERTKSALDVKKAQGVKLGAASEKYKETMSKKSSDEIRQIAKKRGAAMRKRFAAQKDTQVFVKVLRRAFPDACEAENPKYWAWGKINTRGHNKVVVLGAMRDLHDFDNNIFADWDFDNMNIADMQRKLSGRIYALRRSYLPS